ncbi:MAG: DUF2811 domain-containing protein [Kastovskya adunca ATA6-11-RM4]|jgi:hypothetical protein|nr:DUF2811 domain-containing protein [Kastovskya adunca ATA6-11-RM4]
MEEISPQLVITFLQSYCQGASKGMRGADLIEAMTKTLATPSKIRRLRHVVSELRDQGFAVCSTPETGYYWASSSEEINGVCKWLHCRAVTSLRIIGRLKRNVPALEGQLSLPIAALNPQIPQVSGVNYSRPVQISLVAHIPQELHQILKQYAEAHNLDTNELYTQAIAAFLFQQGVLDVAEVYSQSLENGSTDHN